MPSMKRSKMKTEIQLACELMQILDGVSIELARNALTCAIELLSSTQVVSKQSPLLLARMETAKALGD